MNLDDLEDIIDRDTTAADADLLWDLQAVHETTKTEDGYRA